MECNMSTTLQDRENTIDELRTELDQLRADKARLVDFAERTVRNFEGYWDDSSVEHLIYDGKQLLTEMEQK